MGRIGDAWLTLWGRRDYQIRASAQLARIEAEWASICTEISNLLEHLNRLDSRLKKREQRAQKPKPQPAEPTHLPEPQSGAVATRKAAARARFAQRGIYRSPQTELVIQHPLPSQDGADEPSE